MKNQIINQSGASSRKGSRPGWRAWSGATLLLIIAFIAFTGCDRKDGDEGPLNGVWTLHWHGNNLVEVTITDGTGTITDIYDYREEEYVPAGWEAATKRGMVTRGTVCIKNLRTTKEGEFPEWECDMLSLEAGVRSVLTGISYKPTKIYRSPDGIKIHDNELFGHIWPGSSSKDPFEYDEDDTDLWTYWIFDTKIIYLDYRNGEAWPVYTQRPVGTPKVPWEADILLNEYKQLVVI
jgi:hypothetical protein